MTNSVKKGLVAVGVLAVASTNVMAAGLTIPTIDTADLYTAGTAVIGLTVAYVLIAKVISMFKR